MATMAATLPCPVISVITPSYNQAKYLERTIQSVIGQEYPDTEHIVIDGGSSDGSANLIARYAEHFAYWVSEKDRGQSHAINKGFEKSTGDVICWLNSDDAFMPGTLPFVGEYFSDNPDVDVLCGSVHVVDADGKILDTHKGSYGGPKQLATYWQGYHMHQPSIFWRRKVYEAIGPLREDLHLTMDFEYWLRMSRRFQIRSVDRVLSLATAHPYQKTADWSSTEREKLGVVLERYGSPFTLRDWDIRCSIYSHLLWIGWMRIKGIKTNYE